VLEMRFEVDVQPFASGSAGAVGSCADEAGADAVVLPAGVDHGVEEKGVSATIPADLDESDELLSVERTDPGERVFLQPLRPRPNLGEAGTERPGMQHAELSVIDGEARHELDRHSRNATAVSRSGGARPSWPAPASVTAGEGWRYD
jgi:hypothetical protein